MQAPPPPIYLECAGNTTRENAPNISASDLEDLSKTPRKILNITAKDEIPSEECAGQVFLSAECSQTFLVKKTIPT